jgi:SET domain-containing protein
MDYYIKTTPEMGRGLYSVSGFEPHKILFTAELLVLSEQDTKTVNTTDLKYYVFKYNETQDCLVLGDAELFNHDISPNIGYKLMDFDDRKVMCFYTLRQIKEHEQLFIDYAADEKVNVDNYTINMIR